MARASSVAGTVRPGALAVLRLMNRKKLVGNHPVAGIDAITSSCSDTA
jgi:hypothetical protein